MPFSILTPANTPNIVALSQAHCPFLTDLTWSPAGDALVASQSGGLSLWRDSFTSAPSLSLSSPAPLKALSFNAEGTQLATASSDTTVHLYDPRTGSPLGALTGHSAGVTAVVHLQSCVVSGAGDGEIRIYTADGSTSTAFAAHTDEISALAAAPDGRWLASASRDGLVKLWDTAGYRLIGQVAFGDWLRSIRVSVESALVAAACKDGTVTVLEVREPSSPRVIVRIDAHEGGADAVTFHPQEALLCTGGRDTVARLWSLPQGELLAELRGHRKPVLAAAFHPAGRFLVTGSGDHHLLLWGSPDNAG